MAGTVKPDTSPRPRAVYRSWMLADWAPSAWLASQTSHWAAAVVGSSVLNAAVQARSRIAVVAEGGFVVDEEQFAIEMGGAAESVQQVGGRGRDVGHRSAVSWVRVQRPWYGPARRGAASTVAGHGTTADPGGLGRRSTVSALTRSLSRSGGPIDTARRRESRLGG